MIRQFSFKQWLKGKWRYPIPDQVKMDELFKKAYPQG